MISRLSRWRAVQALCESPRVKNALIGTSTAWQALVRQVVEAATCSSGPVLVMGESGTGKELIARLIHDLDPRPEKREMVIVDCTTITPELSGSEFFGHERGAFTGALNARDGAFAQANGGTLFLDEIGELPPALQTQLLRVIQEGKYKRIGSNAWQHTRFRLISATNRDLEACVADGSFREDLYHRLRVVSIAVPPLRERKEDIPLLVKHFVEIYARENHKDIEGVSEDVLEILDAHAWPGNVRELENLLERAVVLSRSNVITRTSLPPFLLRQDGVDDQMLIASEESLNLRDRTQAFQKKIIQAALKKTKGVQNKAATVLGVKPTTLNEMIKRLGIDTGPDPG